MKNRILHLLQMTVLLGLSALVAGAATDSVRSDPFRLDLREPASGIRVTVQDQNEGNAAGAYVLRYPSAGGTLIDGDTTNSAGEVTFPAEDLSIGETYRFRATMENPDSPFGVTAEWWASGEATAGNELVTLTLLRDMPYVSEFKLKVGGQRASLGSPVPVGTEVEWEATVVNNSGEDWPVRVNVWVDEDREAPIDHELSSGTVTFDAGETDIVSGTFTVTTEGTYARALQTEVLDGSNWRMTDSRPWFDVLTVGEVAPPVLRLTGETDLGDKPAMFDSGAVLSPYVYSEEEAIFRVEYFSAAGIPPKSGYPKLVLTKFDLRSNRFIEVSDGRRTLSRQGDTPEGGIIFETRLFLETGAYVYYFEAEDQDGRQAIANNSELALVTPPDSTEKNPNFISWNYRSPDGVDSNLRDSICLIHTSVVGTGFLIGPRTVLTAYHNIDQVDLRVDGSFDVDVTFPNVVKDGAALKYSSAKLISDIAANDVGNFTDSKYDWAVLELSSKNEVSEAALGYLETRYNSQPVTGLTLGFPTPKNFYTEVNDDLATSDIEPVNLLHSYIHQSELVEQYVSQLDWQNVNWVGIFENDHWRSLEFVGHPGNSGGPFMDGDGRAVGIVVGTGKVDDQLAGYVLPLSSIGESTLRPFIGEQTHLDLVSVYSSAGETVSASPLSADELVPDGEEVDALAAVRVVEDGAQQAMSFTVHKLSAKTEPLSESEGDNWSLRFYDLGYDFDSSEDVQIFKVDGDTLLALNTVFQASGGGASDFWAAFVPGPGDYLLGFGTDDGTDLDWVDLADLPTARNHGILSVNEDQIYYLGGQRNTGSYWAYLDDFEKYDPVADQWVQLPASNADRCQSAGGFLDGKFYAIGGRDRVSSIEVYDGAWSGVSPGLDRAWNTMGYCADGGKLYLAGGWYSYPTASTAVKIFDPATESFLALPDLPNGRANVTVISLAGYLYVLGGQPGASGDPLDGVERLNLADTASGWETVAPMPEVSLFPMVTIWNGKLLMSVRNSDVLYAYDPSSDAWSEFGRLPQGRSGGSMVVIDGTLYVIGGVLAGEDQATSSVIAADLADNPPSGAPEIEVTYNGTDIVDGDSTPSTAEGTEFGSVAHSSGSVTRVFRVCNIGEGTLTVDAVSSSSSDFGVSQLTVVDEIEPGGCLDYTVTFDPESAGTKTATISFLNNDSDENPFDFVVRGEGISAIAAAPTEADILELLPGRTIGQTTFTSTSRFKWEDEWELSWGNWSYERVSQNQGLLTQTYDEDGNDPSLYREEFLFTFTTATSGTFTYRQYFDDILDITDTGPFDFPWLADVPATWYSSAADLDNSWRYFDWFKGFKPVSENWIYHGRHGWLYVLAEDTSRMFLWDVALGRWMFTSETVYPWMYAYGPDAGWVYFFEGGRPSSRYFKRQDTGQTVSEQQLRVNP